MGLFDHLFKSKSPPSEESSAETGAKPAEPAKPSDPAARGASPQRADPSSFLHPKSFVPRGVSVVGAPTKPGAVSGVRKPGASPEPARVEEIVLTLGDVLSRIPTPYLRMGQHDPKRELRFNINDLSSDIARGRAAVPLSRIAQLVPDIFVKQISRDEDTEVRLPLQKLVEQIGLLRSRPQGASSDRSGRAPVGTASSAMVSDPKLHFPTSMIEVAEPSRETLRDLFKSIDEALELRPVATTAPKLPTAEPVFELKPVAEPPAPEPPPAPEAPAEVAPPPLASETSALPVAEVTEPEVAPPEPVVAAAPVEVAPDQVEVAGEEPAPAPAPVAEVAPVVPPPPPLPSVELPAATPSEPLRPASVAAQAAVAAAPEPMDLDAPETTDMGTEKIHLSLAAILRQCPREIVVDELPLVPDNVRITLPFAPIDRQLVMGHVEVSAVRFVAALPFAYQPYFSARMGVKVPIPLEEVFQNLPSPGNEPPPADGPTGPVLAPADANTVPPVPAEHLVIPAVPPPIPVSLEETPPLSIAPGAPAADAPAPSAPSPVGTPAPDTPVSSTLPAATEVVADAPTPAILAPAADVISVPVESVTVSAPPRPVNLPLHLPAFHHFTPPPPLIIAEKPAPSAVALEAVPDVTAPKPVVLTGPGQPEGRMVSPETFPAGSPVGEPEAMPSQTPEPAATPNAEVPSPPVVPPTPPVVELPADLAVEPAAADEPPVRSAIAPEAMAPAEVAAVAEPVVVPVEPNSPEVFAEASRTIQPPQFFRPFIVLPPPILAFRQSPDATGDGALQDAEKELVEPVITGGVELAGTVGQGDEPRLAPLSEQPPGLFVVPAQREEPAAEGAAPAPEPPSIIAIDFTQAFDSPEVRVEDLPPLREVAPPAVETSAPVENLPPGGDLQPAAELPPVIDLPPPVEAPSAVEPPPPVSETPPPMGDAAPAMPVPPVVDAPIAPGLETSQPVADFPPIGDVSPEMAAPPVMDATPGGEAPVAEVPPVVEAPLAASAPLEEPPVAPEPVTAQSPEPATWEVIPPAFAEAVAAMPVAEPPAPAPQDGLNFVVEGHFVEPLPTPVIPPPPVPRVRPEPASIPGLSLGSAAPAPAEEMPILPIPQIGGEEQSIEVLPPPALPLRRFDQDALQALFMTEEILDLAKISRLAAQLPGIHACVIASRDQACTGGTLPEGFDLAALLGLAPRVGEAAGRMPIGALKHFTLYGERYSVSFFARHGLSLCAVHRPRSFVPGVREKLVAIADELSK